VIAAVQSVKGVLNLLVAGTEITTPVAAQPRHHQVARRRRHRLGRGGVSISQTSLDILLPTMRKPGSQIWFSWNPKNRTDPVDKMFRGDNGPPPNSIVVHVNYYNNPFLSDETRPRSSGTSSTTRTSTPTSGSAATSFGARRGCRASARIRSPSATCRQTKRSRAARSASGATTSG
jgi:Phage terminase large subunit